MKAAFSTWENRIAPVFDASNQIRLVEVEDGKVMHRENDMLPDNLPIQKALRLAELKVDVLFCGAISRATHDFILSCGIRVLPFIAGTIDEIVQAWISGRSDWTCFSMPGCSGGGGRRFFGVSGFFQKKGFMSSRGSGRFQMNTAKGNSGARRSQNRGRAGMYGAAGECRCPHCGIQQQHRPGIPCSEHLCMNCGLPMIRS